MSLFHPKSGTFQRAASVLGAVAAEPFKSGFSVTTVRRSGAHGPELLPDFSKRALLKAYLSGASFHH